MSIFRQRDNEVVCLSNLLVLLKVSVVGLADSVDLANFTESTEKVIGRDWGLAFEVGKPKSLSVLILKDFYDFSSDVVVDDVLKVD